MILDVERLVQTALTREPFEFVIVRQFVKAEASEVVTEDYPKVKRSGSFPLSELTCGSRFGELVDDLNGAAFRTAVEQSFPSICRIGLR